MDAAHDRSQSRTSFDSPSPRSTRTVSCPRHSAHLGTTSEQIDALQELSLDEQEFDAQLRNADQEVVNEVPDITWSRLTRLIVFGLNTKIRHDSNDPRVHALGEINAILEERGISCLSAVDYVRAIRVFDVLSSVNERMKAAEKLDNQDLANTDARVTQDAVAKRAFKASIESRISRKSRLPKLTSSRHARERRQGTSDSSHERRKRTCMHGKCSDIAETEPNDDLQNFDSPQSGPGQEILDQDELAEQNFCCTLEHLQLMHHMLRHAEAVYGLPLNIMSAPGISLTRVTDLGIIVRRTSVGKANLIRHSRRNKAYMPAFYIARDPLIKAIVVCIRGTANLTDSLTDVVATLKSFEILKLSSSAKDEQGLGVRIRGAGHAGVVQSAQNLYHSIRDDIIEAARDNPQFEVLFTGHSLGGAVAAVLCLMMRESCLRDLTQFRALCIGPPPCVTENIAKEANKSVICLVNGADIVPRLSVDTLRPYFATCRLMSELSRRQKCLIDVGMYRAAIDWKQFCDAWLKAKQDLKSLAQERMHIPGIVLQMVEPTLAVKADTVRFGLGKYKNIHVFRVPRTDFIRMRRQKGMFIMHAPHRYRASLIAAMKCLNGGPLKATTESQGVLCSLQNLAFANSYTSSNNLDSFDTVSGFHSQAIDFENSPDQFPPA